MNKIKENRALSYLIVAVTYAAAIVLGIAFYKLMNAKWYIALLVADVAATALVYIVSTLLDNASVYDPYWSVQPIVILTALAAGARTLNAFDILLLIAVWLWGVRLTANWAYTFKRGLAAQDWRYTMLEEKTGGLYPLVNLFGIHLFPTLVVYGCTLPAAQVLTTNVRANALSVICIAVSLIAVLLQLIADCQMQSFRNDKRTRGFIRRGLWKYTRHPNYLCEIVFWWGIALSLIAASPALWYFAAGALVNTLMFLLISIPMADRRLAKREGFDAYRAETRALLPIPRRGAGYTPEIVIEEKKVRHGAKRKKKRKK